MTPVEETAQSHASLKVMRMVDECKHLRPALDEYEVPVSGVCRDCIYAVLEDVYAALEAAQSANCACAWRKAEDGEWVGKGFVSGWLQIAWCRKHGPEAKQ